MVARLVAGFSRVRADQLELLQPERAGVEPAGFRGASGDGVDPLAAETPDEPGRFAEVLKRGWLAFETTGGHESQAQTLV